MEEEFDNIGDELARTFLTKYLPRGEKVAGAEAISQWTAELLADCRAHCPDSVWDDIAVADFRGDNAAFLSFLMGLHNTGASAARWQLTLSDVEQEQEPGVVYFFGEGQPVLFHSAFAQAVEAAVSDRPSAAQEWAHWYLLVGWLGLATICALQPYALTPEEDDDSIFYCVGIEDRVHLYLGARSGSRFWPMMEWN